MGRLQYCAGSSVVTGALSAETMTSDGRELLHPEFVLRLHAATGRLRLPLPAVTQEHWTPLEDAFDLWSRPATDCRSAR